MSQSPGRFISLEGGEGTGKSTQARRLGARLRERGIDVVLTREPGGSPGAEQIRKLVVEGEGGRWTPITETLLVYAARADHVARTIGPALARGAWVITDRFNDSTFAYQGAGRGVPRETIRRIDAAVLDDFKPDLTLILDLAVEEGLARAGARGGAETRFESLDHDFHQRMRAAFLDIARRQAERCRLIDAAADEESVAAAIWAAVQARFDL
jgi:dTMP kinase